MKILSQIRTVLVHNSHSGNIGASARALKNMGMSQLTLVAPREFPSKEAEARASNAQDLLTNTKVFATLEEALAGSTLVLGCSGRQRKLSLPIFSPREAARKIKQHLNVPSKPLALGLEKVLPSVREKAIAIVPIREVAIVYGNEQHGLSNEELATCTAQIVIPTASEYASLNLAQAVQIISYEIFLALTDLNTNAELSLENNGNPNPEVENLTSNFENIMPSYESLAEFYQTLEKTLVDIHYLDLKKPGQMMARLKHLFARAEIDKTELTLLRGMLTAIQTKTNGKKPAAKNKK